MTRRGTNGVDQVDTPGLTVALFRLHTSRTADPQLHTHAVIAAKVADPMGRWLSLDARFLEAAALDRLGLRRRPARRADGASQVAWDPVPEELRAPHLARTGRHDPEARVFQAPGGGPVRATNFRRDVYGPAVERAGLDGLTFHRLRHSAAYIMRELGVPLEVIQKRLSHRSIRTTADVYGSLPECVDREVADRLDAALRDGAAVPTKRVR